MKASIKWILFNTSSTLIIYYIGHHFNITGDFAFFVASAVFFNLFGFIEGSVR